MNRRDNRAERIVDYMLACLDKMGRFEGRAAQRRLVLQDILNFRTGTTTSGFDFVVENVRRIVNGKPHLKRHQRAT